jgi:hypothetical protein
MKSITILIIGFIGFSIFQMLDLKRSKPNEIEHIVIAEDSEYKDTCVLDGKVFEIVENKAPNPLQGIIKNGRIHVFDLQGNELNIRVIRYVFSVRSDDHVSSIRSYGDLVSYPVLQLLKYAKIDEPYYFEEIIIVDQNKEIQNNAVRPIIIKRVAN